MKICLFFILSSIILSEAKFLDDVDLIQKYFEEKSVRHATVFGCFNKNEKINVAKALMRNQQSMSIFNINQNQIHNKLKSKYNHIGVILDGDCLNINEFLITCSRLNFFDEKHHWLIFTSTDVSPQFVNVSLNINSDIHVVTQNVTSKIWTIYDLYNPASGHGGSLKFTKIGVYDKKVGYKFEKQDAKYWVRKNVTGVTFKSMVVLPEPFSGTLGNYLNSDDNRTVNTFNRFHSRLTSFCRDYYNYSVDIVSVKSWGYTNPDGSFDGMVGALEQKVIDFGSSPLFFREDRAKVIDYGRNTWILRAAFLFRNPKVHTSIEIFLHPLPTSAWIITGILGIISIVILKMVTTFERKKHHHQTETSWGISVLQTIGALCQQGAPTTPKMTCGRITTISIFLLSILIYQFYSASLVSHLLMKPMTNLKTLRDLLESSLSAGCENILYDKDYLKRTTDEVAIELYHKKILGPKNTSNFFSPERGLKLVEAGNYAFHVETATAYPIIEATFREKAICELREIQLFSTQLMHANYQKRSPFREMFDTCYQRLAEHGLLFRERKHWHPRKPECIQSSKSISFHVGVDEMYPALVILLTGVVSSLVILFVEKQFSIFKEKPVFVLRKKVPFPFVK